MKWYWIILICLFIVGYFGIFWTLNLSNIEIDLNMDNNTLQAMESIDYRALENMTEEKDCGVDKMINKLVLCDEVVVYDGVRAVHVMDVRCLVPQGVAK